MLSITPSTRIVATILAKNEEDIIAHTIEHHLEQGVTHILLTNNNSTDRTREIAEKYPEVEIIDEPGDTHDQSKWVTRMARLACKLNPDWIIHLDADELWCGLQNLRKISGDAVACQRMYLHPPTVEEFSLENMRFYLNFDDIPIPQETKVAHRPDESIEIAHGNHAVLYKSYGSTTQIWRHHYPIRSQKQWESKSQGHLCLRNRNVTCERWERWYNMIQSGSDEYSRICSLWQVFRQTKQDFGELIKYWATEEMVRFFQTNQMLPHIEEWPRNYERKSHID